MKFPRVRWPGLLLASLTGVLIGSGAYTFDYVEGTSYLSNDPRACVNCHIMREQYDGWQKTTHHAVASCNDCHVPHDLIGKYMAKVEHGYRHSKGFTFQDFHEPIRITDNDRVIVEENCLRCHGEFVSHIRLTAKEGEAPGCTRCHSDVGHGPKR